MLLLLLLSLVSDSVRPHRWQPTRLHQPWDSPGKNTGVGCHFLLQCMKVKSEREAAQSCPTLRNPMDCSLPGSSVHGIFQAGFINGKLSFRPSSLPCFSLLWFSFNTHIECFTSDTSGHPAWWHGWDNKQVSNNSWMSYNLTQFWHYLPGDRVRSHRSEFSSSSLGSPPLLQMPVANAGYHFCFWPIKL